MGVLQHLVHPLSRVMFVLVCQHLASFQGNVFNTLSSLAEIENQIPLTICKDREAHSGLVYRKKQLSHTPSTSTIAYLVL